MTTRIKPRTVAQKVPDKEPRVLALLGLRALERYKHNNLEHTDDMLMRDIVWRLATVARDDEWKGTINVAARNGRRVH